MTRSVVVRQCGSFVRLVLDFCLPLSRLSFFFSFLSFCAKNSELQSIRHCVSFDKMVLADWMDDPN